jgi:transposase InsO family protein
MGIDVSRPKVARSMRKGRIQSMAKKKFKITTNSSHKYPIVGNIFNRGFDPLRSRQVLVSDITYIKTVQGWL